jgi:hypothetical protein
MEHGENRDPFVASADVIAVLIVVVVDPGVGPGE